jgi:hypothetical protein
MFPICLPVYFVKIAKLEYLVDTQTQPQEFLGICLIHTNSPLMYQTHYSVQLITRAKNILAHKF